MTIPATRVDLDDALTAILNDVQSVPRTESVQTDVAEGRILAEPIDAPVSLPPFAASAMDGYALRSADAAGLPPTRLPIAGVSYAGHPAEVPIPAGSCARVFTGAALPANLDTVVIQEDCNLEDDHVVINVPVVRGAHVRPAGHDVQAGTRLMNAGRRLSVFDLAWLAASGTTVVRVCERPVVGLFSNGDELVEPGDALAPGQIYDANRHALRLLLRQLPVEIRDYGIVSDNRADLTRVLRAADDDCDLILTSGGVSVGDADWVKEAVGDIGALKLWKLNLKPGKPLAYGRLRRAIFFGLPGNPVSALVTAMMLVRPVLERICGAEPTTPLMIPARLRGALHHEPGREEFQRGTLQQGPGGLEVSVTGDQSSNRLASFAIANCLIRIPKESGDLEDGCLVTVLPFHGLLR
jgi:molybdopterin molybdotransferase